MKKIIVILCLLIASTCSAERVMIDESTYLDSTSMRLCNYGGIFVYPGENPLIVGTLVTGFRTLQIVVDSSNPRVGFVEEYVFNKWGDIVSYTDFTQNSPSNVTVSTTATVGNVSATTTKTIKVHSHSISWARPAEGSLYEKYYNLFVDYANDNYGQLIYQSKQSGNYIYKAR